MTGFGGRPLSRKSESGVAGTCFLLMIVSHTSWHGVGRAPSGIQMVVRQTSFRRGAQGELDRQERDTTLTWLCLNVILLSTCASNGPCSTRASRPARLPGRRPLALHELFGRKAMNEAGKAVCGAVLALFSPA